MKTRFFMLTLLYFTAHLLHGLPMNSTNKIIGGVDMSIKSVPFALSLMLDDEYACCAFIVTKHWAATAAHCVKAAEYPPKKISLRSGSSFLYKDGIVHNVVNAIIHENYSDTANDYDIAVMKVMPLFRYGDFTKPVGLAQNGKNVYIEWGVVCGWGYYKKVDNFIDPIIAERIQCVSLPLVEKEQCQIDYNFMFEITSRMTCYGFQHGIIDSCQGDSGSALVNKDNIVIGITSWGLGCAEPNQPGVYTNTVFLQNWLRDKTKECT